MAVSTLSWRAFEAERRRGPSLTAKNSSGILAPFAEAGIATHLVGYSALDRYFRVPEDNGVRPLHIFADATVAEIAPLVDELQFGGGPLVDAIASYRGTRLCVRCRDGGTASRYPFTVQHLRFDPRREVFLDPDAIYYDLRKPELVRRAADLEWWQVIAEAAQLISRYHFTFVPEREWIDAPVPPEPAPYQRHLLERILTSRAPDNGLRLLRDTGIVASWWPELAAMAGSAPRQGSPPGRRRVGAHPGHLRAPQVTRPLPALLPS